MIREATESVVHVCTYCNTLVENLVSGCENCDVSSGATSYTTSPNLPLPEELLEACGEHARTVGELPETPALLLLDEITRLQEALTAATALPPPCTWTEQPLDDDFATTCGHAFQFAHDPPYDYVKICCYCGKPVVFVAAPPEKEDSDE